MRIDTHLVDIGEKEYPGETGDASAGESGQSGNTGSGGSRPGGSGDPDDPDDPGASTEDLLYEPASSENQTTAARQDVDPSFSIEVKSSDSSLTVQQVMGMITATDLSVVDEDGDAVTGCIRVSGSGGTYTITGVHSAYDEQGMPVEGAGFATGHTYKIVLDDDRLTFAGQAESVREYDFTVIRQEDMNGRKYLLYGFFLYLAILCKPMYFQGLRAFSCKLSRNKAPSQKFSSNVSSLEKC